ncbi:MAG TPA: ATP-binding cassette domain-containing protein [Syntrophomonadaceae bacterium]|nr:ATP-binding cassette domain-containing protein [Syntrophomonadaceae bacterium]
MIKKISILSGYDKKSKKEEFEKVDIFAGEIIALVGVTGSGKTRLISDIEQHAYGETPTRRKVLINDIPAPEYFSANYQEQFIGQVTQNMNFVMDTSVGDFLKMHAECRGVNKVKAVVEKVLTAANELSGEDFGATDDLTSLSGGQARALMIADVALISNVSIVLMDEIENAGIDRLKAFKFLTGYGKISITSTHDPLMSLMADRRIVMQGGGIRKVLVTNNTEKELIKKMLIFDSEMQKLRNTIRSGGQVEKLSG